VTAERCPHCGGRLAASLPRGGAVLRAVRDQVAGQPAGVTVRDIIAALPAGVPPKQVYNALGYLTRRKLVRRLGYGAYCATEALRG
jgi:DNA-binding IclR family transcriptional regulator